MLKKSLLIAIVCICMILLCGCNTDTPDITEEPTEEIVQPTEEAVERGPVNHTVHDDASEKDFSFNGREKVNRPTNTPDSASVKIDNKTYEFSYFDSVKLFSASETSKFKDRAIVNRYRNDTRSVELLKGSNKLVFFFTDVSERVKEGSFTEEEAVEAAKAVIAELYGADAIEEYSRIQFADNGEPKEKYSIGFSKKIFGYDTNDHITVNFDMAGNLVSLNAYKFGIMHGAEKDLTQEEIEKAIAYVNDTFSDDWNVSTPSVVVDTEGDYYIEVGISRKVGDIIQAMQIHVNIR